MALIYSCRIRIEPDSYRSYDCALGTSLPELVTSIVAARKNEVDMALGNVMVLTFLIFY